MNKKTTIELEQSLKNLSVEDFEKFASGVYTDKEPTLKDYLNEYMGAHSLKPATIIKDALIDKNYAHNIFNGHRTNPSRDRMLAICVAMGMNLEETQRALKLSDNGALYPKVERDAFIMVNIQNGIHNVGDLNERLHSEGLDMLKLEKQSRDE